MPQEGETIHDTQSHDTCLVKRDQSQSTFNREIPQWNPNCAICFFSFTVRVASLPFCVVIQGWQSPKVGGYPTTHHPLHMPLEGACRKSKKPWRKSWGKGKVWGLDLFLLLFLLPSITNIKDFRCNPNLYVFLMKAVENRGFFQIFLIPYY